MTHQPTSDAPDKPHAEQAQAHTGPVFTDQELRAAGYVPSYDPLRRLTAQDWRARVYRLADRCRRCDGYGRDFTTETTCPACAGTGESK